MAGTDDLSGDLAGLSEAQLVQAYIENVRAYEATEHIGKKNRLSVSVKKNVPPRMRLRRYLIGLRKLHSIVVENQVSGEIHFG